MELINTFNISLDRLGSEDVQLIHRNETEESKMKFYGLTQKFIKTVRAAFKSGELSFDDAMWLLEYERNASEMSYIQDDINEN